MLKNNAGYDLKQMFIGSEGTLGVITRAVLRLFPKPRSLQTAICAVRDYDGAVELLRLMKASLGASLSAFEMMWPDFYFLATDLNKRRAPVAHGAGAYILVEAMGVHEERDAEAFSLAIGQALEAGVVTDAVVAQSRKESGDLWAIRDASGEFPKLFWPYVGFDVSLPVARIGEFVAECTRRIEARWPRTKYLYFGHIADSNIHIAVQTAERPLPDVQIDELVYDAVRDFKGSVSAEHGIGILKRPYLGFTRGPVELALMKRLKASLDPNGILNPQKIFQ
jgi:FAD/FMN-containing dehydrogenase